MAIEITDVPIFFSSVISPAEITTLETPEDSHFNLSLKVSVITSDENPLVGKDGNYKANFILEDPNYDLSQLPEKAVAIPLILSFVNKSNFITFNFTSAIPNYDQQDFRRPFITKLRLNMTPSDLASQSETLVILNTYLLIIDLSDVD